MSEARKTIEAGNWPFLKEALKRKKSEFKIRPVEDFLLTRGNYRYLDIDRMPIYQEGDK